MVPRKAGSKQEVVLTVDSGVTKTLLAEKHWRQLLKQNPGWQLEKANTKEERGAACAAARLLSPCLNC